MVKYICSSVELKIKDSFIKLKSKFHYFYCSFRWMAATLIDFYINIFAISVRILNLCTIFSTNHEIDAIMQTFWGEHQINMNDFFAGLVFIKMSFPN